MAALGQGALDQDLGGSNRLCNCGNQVLTKRGTSADDIVKGAVFLLGLQALRGCVDTLITIPNQRLLHESIRPEAALLKLRFLI